MASTLERRLTALITKKYAATVAGYFDCPQLNGLDDPDELARAILDQWNMDGLGGYTVGELDGLLKKIGKSLKRTLVTAPLKGIKATVQTIKTGSLKPMKAAIKEEVKAVKDDVKTIAPVAAVVANVIPGVGQVISAGLAAVGGALKVADQKAAQKAANAAAIADNAQIEAANQAATAAAAADVKAAQDAALKAQADALAAQKQAQLTADANAAFQATASAGLIQPGMSPNDVANAVATNQLAQRGLLFTSPESQDILSDTVKAYQPTVAEEGSSFDLQKWGMPLAIGAGVLLVAVAAKRRGRRHV